MKSTALISVVVPIYNEAGNIPDLYKRLTDVFREIQSPYEIILVNDGSRDASWERMQELSEVDPHVTSINLRRNSGQTAALMCAIDHSKGEIIIALDADLQNDPADIPALLSKLDEGYDLVSGWRKDRKDAAIRRNFVSRIANRLISYISGVHLKDYGCSLKAYRREVLTNVRLYGEMHRFIPIYASWMGARIAEIAVQHHPRMHGRSNYGLERIFKVVLDLIVVKFMDRYMVKPIYIFGGFGIFVILLSIVSGIWAIGLKFISGVSLVQTPLPLFSAISFLTGTTSILLGLVSEIVVRTYFESQGKTSYQVKEVLSKASKTR